MDGWVDLVLWGGVVDLVLLSCSNDISLIPQEYRGCDAEFWLRDSGSSFDSDGKAQRNRTNEQTKNHENQRGKEKQTETRGVVLKALLLPLCVLEMLSDRWFLGVKFF